MTKGDDRQKRNNNKRSDVGSGVPLFLRKTFELVSTSDPSVVSWSSDGSMIIIKNPDLFQEQVIPQYFKHNKFTSFVRQLHFYGFHKIKTEPLNLVNAAESEAAKYWTFHHDNFHRDFPERLVEIKKASKPEPVDKQEVEALKREIKEIKSQIADMTENYEGLRAVVGTLLQQQMPLQEVLVPGPKKKKRKVSQPDVATSMSDVPLPQQDASFSFPSPLTSAGRNFSVGMNSWNPDDEKFLAQLLETEYDEGEKGEEVDEI